MLDAGFTNAQQLLEAGLISRIGWDDEVAVPVDQVWTRSLGLVRDQFTVRRHAKKVPGVAVVPVVGAIVSGRSRPTPGLLTGPTAGSETVVAALRRAERDPLVKAIVLYVDSGGGSALASDVIGRAVARCPKPVVAVMGEVAASGGYYVLAQADHVVASPFTLTGSIGVVVGKPVLEELNERIGRNPETLGRELALFGSSNRPFSDAERAWAERMMEEVYARFVARVAAGRRLTPERVDELGRGRLWSGSGRPRARAHRRAGRPAGGHCRSPAPRGPARRRPCAQRAHGPVDSRAAGVRPRPGRSYGVRLAGCGVALRRRTGTDLVRRCCDGPLNGARVPAISTGRMRGVVFHRCLTGVSFV